MDLRAKTFSPEEAFAAAAAAAAAGGGESAVRTMAQLDSNQSTAWNGSTARQPNSDSPTLQNMLAKLIQQNEDLKAMVQAQRGSRSDDLAVKVPREPVESNRSSSSEQQSPRYPKQSGASVKFRDVQDESSSLEPDSSSRKSVPSSVKQQRELARWDMNLPEIDWTDEDELMLEKLDSGDLEDAMLLPSTSASDPTSSSTAAAKANKIAEHDRTESRKRLAKLISTSMNTSSAMRKPRWRIETERESGAIASFSDQDVEPMKQMQVFRSAVSAVVFTVHLRQLLRGKKLEQKDKALHDFESMLTVYFEATRVWLGKIVRNPLMSVLQDPALDFDLSTKSTSKGFATKFGTLFALRSNSGSTTNSTTSRASGMDEGKFVKLKVRVKGIVDVIAKAVEKQDIPSGILDFWRRLTSDGLYFPESYKLFSGERGALEFDELGATRRILDESSLERPPEGGQDSDGAGSSSSVAFSRFNVVLVNFLFVRILIPHILLQPSQVGIGSVRVSNTTALNLKNLATTFYQLCALMSPLPPVVVLTSSNNSSTTRKTSVSQPDQETGVREAKTDENTEQAPDVFLSIEEIGQLLIPNAKFPIEDPRFQQFAKEQQVRLDGILRKLRAQIHKV